MALAQHRPRTARADAASTRGLVSRLGGPLMLLLAAGLSLAAMALPVVQSSDAASTGYAIRAKQQQLADLTARDYGLEADLAELSSTSRIAQAAKQLGMVPAPRVATSVVVDAPPPASITMPGSYLTQQTPAQPDAPAVAVPPARGRLWHVLHALHLR